MESGQIQDDDALDAALRGERFLLFKHSQRCGISSHAFGVFAAFVSAQPALEAGWIDVVADRALALHVADRTGVPHASPQVLWLVDGAVAWEASHFDITFDALESAVRSG